MKNNTVFMRIAILVGFFSLGIAANPGFSVKNLGSIPKYERYEFTGKGSSVKKLPVVIEYKTKHMGKADAHWEISSEMLLRETLVEEQYHIQHKNLLVNKYRRKMMFERGSVINQAMLDIDVTTDDPQEFIVGTMPALTYVLRTFPFDSDVKELHVRTPQQSKGYLNLRVKNKGLTNLKTTHQGVVSAYHIEVSLMIPMLGAVLPKLNYYYKNDAQKTLVAMKGVMPATGGKLDVELKSYMSQ